MSHKKMFVSVVLYKTTTEDVSRIINSVIAEDMDITLVIVDNSPTDTLRKYCVGENIKYVASGVNRGYGSAHNIALKEAIACNVQYHLVVNPDVYFDKGALERLYDFMESHQDVGLVQPRILYPDGKIQHLCKLLPTPYDWFIRHFLRFRAISEKHGNYYELRFSGYNKTIDVPYLSGCFMFLRVDVLKKVGLFDERFFMYIEDTDLSRRMYEQSRAVFYPEVEVYHGFGRASRKKIKSFKDIVVSAIRYFNKWGWFFDEERNRINKETLAKCRK